MNEKEKVFRNKIAPLLRDLAKLCRLNDNAFVTIVEIEPGKMIQVSYLPERSRLKQALRTKPDAVNNKEHLTPEQLNERKVNIAKGIRAERG